MLSLFKRFNGLLQLVHFETAHEPTFVQAPLVKGDTFNDPYYLIAPALDPTIKNNWVAVECTWLDERQKAALIAKIQSILLHELKVIEKAHNIVPPVNPQPPSPLPPDSAASEMPAQTPKKPRLLAYKQKAETLKPAVKTLEQELQHYLTFEVDNLEPEVFWCRYATEFPRLSILATKILCAVASGSPFGRVFSVAGSIIRPRRS